MQAVRAGVPVPPPAAVDVDVNVTGQGSGKTLLMALFGKNAHEKQGKINVVSKHFASLLGTCV
jgi:hypothetical protein